MWALEQPWVSPPRSVLAGTPLAPIAMVGGIWISIGWLAAVPWVPDALVRTAALAALHGGLLAVALAWREADTGVPLPPGATAITIALLGVGIMAATLDPRAAVMLAGPPAWLAALALQGRLVGLGIGAAVPARPVVVGALIGALLGGHLLLSASQTLCYPLRAGGVGALLGRWSYDVGANVLSAECFFRGALFNRLQRRWSFGPAAAMATALSLVRYLGDPLLPGQSEVMVGALVYLTMLGVVNCWLLWWSGSLVPGLASAALFFLAYRALAIG